MRPQPLYFLGLSIVGIVAYVWIRPGSLIQQLHTHADTDSLLAPNHPATNGYSQFTNQTHTHSQQITESITGKNACPIPTVQPSSVPTQLLNILIFTAYRSGSSFTGELFKQNPNILYLFEPFKLMRIPDNEKEPSRSRHLEDIKHCILPVVHDMFACKYTPLYNYSLQHFKRTHRQSVNFWRQRVFIELLKGPLQASRGRSIQQLEQQCMLYKYRAIKMIRGYDMSRVWPYVAGGGGSAGVSNNTMLYLVRDPRGVLSSRLHIEQFSAGKETGEFFSSNASISFVSRAKRICRQYTENVEFLSSAVSANTSKSFRLIRYEDIAYNKIDMAKKIYGFLNIPVHPRVLFWLNMSSNVRPKQRATLLTAFNTIRHSESTAEAWRKHLPYDLVQQIDVECGEAMKLLGYDPASDYHTYADTSVSYVNKLTVPYGLS